MSTPEATPEKKKSKTAFEAPRGTVFRMDPDKLVILGLDTDHAPGSHPLFSEAEAGRLEMPLDEDFLLSVREFGIITAVTVVKLPVKLRGETEAKECAVVVAGRRRVRHAREINKIYREKGQGDLSIQVPASVFSGGLDDAGLLTFIENEHRDDTPPLDKARAAARLAARGVPDERICMLFRLSARGLRQYLKLVQLHPDVLSLFSEGKITLLAAEDIARKEYSDQPDYAKSLIQAGGGTANRRALGGGGATGGDGEATHSRGFSAGALRKLVTQIPSQPGEDPDVDLVREVIAWVISKEVAPGSRLESVLNQRVKGKPGRKKKDKGEGEEVKAKPKTPKKTAKSANKAASGEDDETPEVTGPKVEESGGKDTPPEESVEAQESGETGSTDVGSEVLPAPVEAPPPPNGGPATGALDMSTLLQGLQNTVSQAISNT